MRLITEDNKPELVEALQKLQEEAAEVIQAASKVIRFGLAGKNPKASLSNVKHLADEIADLMAIIGLIVHESELAIDYIDVADPNIIEAKVDKFRKYSIYWQNEHSDLDHVC